MADNLVQMLEASVNQHGDRPAVWDPNPEGQWDMMTYSELWNHVIDIAGKFHNQGVQAQDRVGMLAASRSWWPIVDFSVMSLGAAVVPIYPSLPPNQMEFIIQHSGMVGLVVQNMKQLRKLMQIPQTAVPTLQFVLVLDDSRDDALLSDAASRYHVQFYSDWIRAVRTITESKWRSQWSSLNRDDMATIVFTSGTTGVPKGVVLTHGNLVSNVEGIREIVRLTPSDRSLSYLPLSHIFERTAGQFVPFDAGSSIAYTRDFNQIVEDFALIPPTIFTTVPRLLEKVQEGVVERTRGGLKEKLFRSAINIATRVRVDKAQGAGGKLWLADKLVLNKIRDVFGGQMRTIIVGGAPMPRYVGKFFTAAGLSVTEGYGMTETSPVVCVNRPESPVLGTAGVILSNVQVRIAADGEVLVKGPNVMQGYFRNEAATAEAFTEDGWLSTGDIGRITNAGELQITDRKKNLIVLSTGKKVTPAPIEGDILKNPLIDQVVLIGQGYKYISAIVAPNEAMVMSWFEEKGGRCPDRATWDVHPALRQYLLQQIQEATADYAKFEQPKQIIVAREAFTVENGQLTPTLKARAKAVVEAYRRDIEGLYEDAVSAAGPA